MKPIRVFPENPKSDVEFYINPQHISAAFIAFLKNTGKFQLWINVGGDSYHVGTYDTKLAAEDRLCELFPKGDVLNANRKYFIRRS